MVNLIRRRKKARRVLVIGLDCAAPGLVFDQFRDDLPVLSGLMRQGIWGELESSIPCITIPAWSSMLSSRDPGVLGCYGFRNRVDRSYNALQIADSSLIQQKRVWDYIGEAGRESIVLNVPQTYPVRPLNGIMVSGLLTPGTESAFAYPAIFKQEALKIAPDYRFDVKGFRTMKRADLLQQIIDMTETQFKLARHCLVNKPWDFFMHVNIGLDRIHHAFWRYHDPQHRLHEPDSPFIHTVRDFYKLLDFQIGQMLQLIDDDVTVLVVSDHGAKRMDGAICVNEWLWRNGWLSVKNPPADGEILPFEQAEIDWSQTKAWAAGGYYARIFLNIAGREPQGIVPQPAYKAACAELSALLAALPDPKGNPLQTTVFQPETIYKAVRGIAPDLLVYFGDLHWRAVGSFGYGRHYTLENDTGPDDANHATHGIFILVDPGQSVLGQRTGCQLMDIAPTVLHQMRLSVPGTLQGRPITP